MNWFAGTRDGFTFDKRCAACRTGFRCGLPSRPRAHRRPETSRRRSCVAQDISAIEGRGGRLLEADRRKDEFLATLAHELRNRLAPVRIGRVDAPRGRFAIRCSRARTSSSGKSCQMARLLDDCSTSRGSHAASSRCARAGEPGTSPRQPSKPACHSSTRKRQDADARTPGR